MIWTTRPRSKYGALTAISQGDGPLVVLLHGVGLRAEAWNAQIDALVAAGFRVLAPDMPGHGKSAVQAIDELHQFADLAAPLITEPAMVVGHSMGAMIALDLACRPDLRIQSVAALNAIFGRDPDAARAVQARADALDGVSPADPTTALDRWFGTSASDARSACDQWLRAADPAGYKAAYTVFSRHDGPSETALAALPFPALFMTGGLEPNSTPAMSHAMARRAPMGRAKIIDPAAHMLPMTHPDDVNTALISLAQETLR